MQLATLALQNRNTASSKDKSTACKRPIVFSDAAATFSCVNNGAFLHCHKKSGVRKNASSTAHNASGQGRRKALLDVLKTIEKIGQTTMPPYLRFSFLIAAKKFNEREHAMLALPTIAVDSLPDDMPTAAIASVVQEFALFGLRAHTSVPIEHEPCYGTNANHFNTHAAEAAAAPTRRSPILAFLVDELTCGQFVPIYVSLLRLPSVQLECRCF